MAIIEVPRNYPLTMRHLPLVRNDVAPDWRVPIRIARRLNFANYRLRKHVFYKTTGVGGAPQGSGSQVVPWRWQFKTGGKIASSDTDLKLRVWGAMLPSDAGTLADPRWRVVTSAGNSSYRRYTSLDGEPEWTDLAWTFVDVDGLASETTVTCAIEIEDNMRLVAASAYVLADGSLNTDATGYVVDSREYAHENEITDAQHTELVQDVGHNLWKHNGSHLISLSPESESGFWTRTSATFVNILESGASTTVSSSTPGYNLGVTYHNPQHKDTFICTFAAYGSRDTGTGGTVRLADSGGTLADITGWTTTAEWRTATAAIDATDPKVDIQFAGSGSNTLTIEAVCLYCEET